MTGNRKRFQTIILLSHRTTKSVTVDPYCNTGQIVLLLTPLTNQFEEANVLIFMKGEVEVQAIWPCVSRGG